MSLAFLWINAAMYLVLGVLCAVRPQSLAEFVGFQLAPGGTSEFMTVYGGLEFGLGLFFAWCAWNPDYLRTGVVFSVLLYLPLALVRVTSLALAPPSAHNLQLAAFEVSLCILAVLCFLLRR
jgi:hypothetical protein